MSKTTQNKSCTHCDLYSSCHFEPRRKMYNRKCYIDQLSERLKKAPLTILKQLIEIDNELYLDTAMIAYSFSRDDWILLDQSDRKSIMREHIERFRDWRIKHEKDYTHNANLKRRLLAYAEKHPDLCKLTNDDGQGGLRFEIDKHRISLRITEPYTAERRAAASELAKKTNPF